MTASARRFWRCIEANGVVYRTEGQAAQIEGATRVEAVQLDNGQRLPADLVLVGIGVTPATAPFTDLPKEKDQSLLVDGGMRVADGLWAAGDIATFTLNGQPSASNIGAWRNNRHGSRRRTCSVATNITSTCRISGPGTLAKTTTTLATPQAWDEVEFKGDPGHPPFIGLFGKNGVVIGGGGLR